MTLEKNSINAWILNEKKLLDELANDISNEYWIDKEQVKKLIKNKTLTTLDSLRSEINKEESFDKKEKYLNNTNLEKLFFTLKWALEIIEHSSQIEIKSLRKDIEKSINIEDFKNKIEDFLPANLVKKAKNPWKFHEHILGFALWSTNSILTTVEYLYQIWKWILLAPYHLYMIVSWKATTDSFKDI